MHVYNQVLTKAPNKHQQRTEATRQKLLKAALRVFSRDGFERARLEDIAADAGHTRGAFYANFATKEDLFIALLEHQVAKRMGEISTALKVGTDPLVAIKDYYLSRGNDRQWSILTLEFKLYVLRNKAHRAHFIAALRRIRETYHLELMNSIQRTSNPAFHSDKSVKILLGVILNGLLLEQACDPRYISSSEVTDLLSRMFDILTSSNFRAL